MKAAPFAYRAPSGLDEVCELLGRYGPEAAVLAGGQSLVPLMAMRLARPRILVDLNGVPELAGIRDEPGLVAVAAMTRQRAVERSALVAARLPLLVDATTHIGHPQVRNRGTVGGSLAAGHPGAELPAVALALDAEIVVAGPRSGRAVPAADLRLGAGELLTEIRFRVPPPGAGHGFRESGRRARDFATAGAAVMLGRDRAGRFSYARVALMGAGPVPVRAVAVENAVLAGAAVAEAAVLAGDLATGESLRDMTVALTLRALADAARRARPGEGGTA